jgi:hypothetical protein
MRAHPRPTPWRRNRTSQEIAQQSFNDELAKAHASGDTEMVEVLTELGTKNGYLREQTGGERMNDEIRRAAGRDVQSALERVKGSPGGVKPSGGLSGAESRPRGGDAPG